MDFDVFSNDLIQECANLNICISEIESRKFYNYMNLLIDWNKKMNLTAIVDPKDIILKHFVDSLTIMNYIDKKSRVADIGSGAGFPGLPIAIVKKEAEFTLLDSLNKRINFLNEVIKNIELTNVNTVHSRAEDFGKDRCFRECYDFVISRAVAPLNILLEYMLPVLKLGGTCICMKAFNIEEELNNCKKACKVLGGYIDSVDEVSLPDTDIVRKNIIIKKIDYTPSKYPRKAGLPSKEPLV